MLAIGMQLTMQQGIGMTSQRTRKRLIWRVEEAGIRNSEVLDVMRHLPRHLFVDEALASHAYEESALPSATGRLSPNLIRWRA